MDNSYRAKSAFVRNEAKKLGFWDVGFSRADSISDHTQKLTEWLSNGYHGEMAYMANNLDKRNDPRLLLEGAKTIISLSFNYFTKAKQVDPTAPIVSKYAYGRDYHKVLKKNLKLLLEILKDELGVVEARAFVDSAPVLERAWAQKSGLGWIGKNTMLIHPKRGSYFFLCELIIDKELEYDEAIKDHCGRCRRCIEACPTGAIKPEGYIIEANKCISYATIEKKGPIPESFKGKMRNRVFGCDICIEVCPWNRFSEEHKEKDFSPKSAMLEMKVEEWGRMDVSTYEKLFNGTPLRRPKFEGIKRNIEFLKKERE